MARPEKASKTKEIFFFFTAILFAIFTGLWLKYMTLDAKLSEETRFWFKLALYNLFSLFIEHVVNLSHYLIDILCFSFSAISAHDKEV
jgi:hypothetical protein